jgi:hypothetical protein
MGHDLRRKAQEMFWGPKNTTEISFFKLSIRFREILTHSPYLVTLDVGLIDVENKHIRAAFQARKLCRQKDTAKKGSSRHRVISRLGEGVDTNGKTLSLQGS